ncbi:MAG TPA: hypothetical protein VGH42_06840 [Verrucomicrobiae bacterium]|jgi:hypothetical protein
MNRIRILHNGDPRNGSPHWMVYVSEDGQFWGEILMKTAGRFLPKDFDVKNSQRFFKIPPQFAKKQLTAQPHCEEIIITLGNPSGEVLCAFLLSEVPKDSDLRTAVEEVVEEIATLASKFNES